VNGRVNGEVLAYLRCPVCGGGLADAGTALRCARGHNFDLARQGYADLTAGRLTHAGDTAAMVAARAGVLAAGHFDFVATAVVKALAAYPRGLAVEVGAGTGFYLAAVLDAAPGLVGLALDVSKPALRRAARRHPRMAAVRADAWRGLPVADGSAAVLLDVFAPRAPAEFRRVLRPDGALVVVTPEPAHLRELVDRLGLIGVDPDKDERLAAGLGAHFALVDTASHTRRLALSQDEVRALVAMGPSAWHVDSAALSARLAALPAPVDVQASVRVSVWRL
jgi:23S rRNA (guanine745-N1)-methyltransferase